MDRSCGGKTADGVRDKACVLESRRVVPKTLRLCGRTRDPRQHIASQKDPQNKARSNERLPELDVTPKPMTQVRLALGGRLLRSGVLSRIAKALELSGFSEVGEFVQRLLGCCRQRKRRRRTLNENAHRTATRTGGKNVD